jgi:hypothetical protein
MKISLYKGTRLGATLLGVLFLLAGCGTPLHDGGASDRLALALDTGTARIRLSGSQVRTLLPATDVLADLYYALRFTAQDRAAVNPVPLHSLSADVELEPGTWTLDVKGYGSHDEAANSADAPVVRGSAELIVKAGGITAVNVIVRAEAETGSGALVWDICFPAEAESARLVITAINGGSVTEKDLLDQAEPDAGGLRNTGTETLAAGYYRLALEVSLPSGVSFPRTARKTAIVHIYNGLATAATEIFGEADFSDLPTFTSIADLSTWLAAVLANTQETPYKIVLRDLDVDDLKEGTDPLGKLYTALNGKYVALDLSGCAGIVAISDSASTQSDNRPDKNGIVSLILPATLKTLGAYAFTGCTSLVSLDWPASETGGVSIGNYAFNGCVSLDSVVLPAGLESIGTNVFQNCLSLHRIELPVATLKTIGASAFQNASLVSLDWPVAPAGASIGGSAFASCSFLTTVSLPDTLVRISDSAFAGCPNLESVYLPANCNTILDTSVFVDNRALTFHVAEGNATFSTLLSGKALIRDNVVVAGPGASGELSLPSGITTINTYAFAGSSLTRVSLPATVTNIGANAFQNCGALQSVNWDTTQIIPNYAFDGCTALSSVTLHNNLTTIGQYAFRYCTGLREITLPASLSTISAYAFQYSGLTALTLPASLGNIGNYAFQNCNALQSISWTVPASSPTLGTYIFAGCAALSSVALPNNLTSTGNYMFQNCTALTAITLPDSLATIGANTFQYSGLTTLTLSNTVKTIGNYAFANCESLQTLSWASAPASPSLGTYAFDGCKALSSVTLPDNLTSIGTYTFRNCDALTTIDLPDSLASIGAYAFQYASLATLTLPAAVKTISNYAFHYCEDLLWVKWPVSPSGAAFSFNGAAFSDCALLEKVELPDNLITIYTNSFANCPNLRVVILRSATPPALSNITAFPASTNTGLRFYVPDSTAVSAYQVATIWSNADYTDKIVEVSTLDPADDPSVW